MISQTAKESIEQEITKYPPDRRASAVMAALRIVQEELGYLNQERIAFVADFLSMPVPRVYEVATFYSMYAHKPQGEHALKVCTNVSCMLRGSDEVVSHLERRLGIQLGEVTADGKFGLFEVECQGACAGAPMLEVDEKFHEHLTPERIDELLEQLA